MNATIVHELKILTASNPLPSDNDPAPVIIVLGRVTDTEASSDAPSHPRWLIMFIGTLAEFHHAFTRQIMQDFDHGKLLSGTGQRVRSADFIRSLNKAIERAQPLTAATLRFCGFQAVTWNENDAQALGICDLPIIAKASFFSNTRYGFEIHGDTDAQRLVLYTLKLRQIAKANKTCTLQTGRPMREQPTRLISNLA